MSHIRRTIKRVLKEAAGISFEVREWAKIIEAHVAEEQKKFRASQPKEEPTQMRGRSWSAGPSEEDDEPVSVGYTHFEDMGSENQTDTAYIYGDDLHVTADALEECPGIERELSGKLFQVTLDGEGGVDVKPARGSYITSYDFLDCIEELVEDHMVTQQPFYDDSYEYLYAAEGGWDENDGWGDISWEDFYNKSGGSFSGGRWSNYKPQPTLQQVIIDGQQYPEAYEKFKVDKWVINNSGRIEYDHRESGYKDGEYTVVLNMPMSSIGGSMLVHEVKHAYDDWNRISKGYPSINDSWEVQNIYTPDFERLVLGGSYKLSPMLHPIIRYYYLGSKLETPAYLENEYDNAGFTNYRDIAKKLMNFKVSNFTNKKGEPAKGLQDSWTNMLIDYNIPYFRKYPDVMDFLRATEKYFNKRGRDIMKRIDKMRYVHNKPAPRYQSKTYTPPKKNNNKGGNTGGPYGDGLPY